MQELRKKIDISSYINNGFEGKNFTQSFKSPVLNAPWLNISPANVATVQSAIAAADQSLKKWSGVSPFERGQLLRSIAKKIRENASFLAEMMTLEIGKPISESLTEVEYAAGYFDWYAGEGERIYGTLIPSRHPHKRISIQYMPVGVCGLITPWNFPLAIPGRKIAAALAAGCTVVLKPSPECPISALAIAYIAAEVGMPAGVINVVIGPEELVGEEMIASMKVRKISFTGSCEVGKLLYRNCADTMKKMTLELGGHAPVIIYDDADLDFAVEQIVAAKFRNSGQTCVAPNRFFVQKSIYTPFSEKLVSAVRKLKVGDPRNYDTAISNVLHPSVTEKYENHLNDALKKGARNLLSPMPAILSGVTPEMKVYHEETFGPLLPLISFTKDEEAIRAANDTEYGLAAYVFTTNLRRADQAVNQLEYGIVGLNDGLPSSPEISFGGMKGSGFGREGGPHAIYDYLVEKCVSAQP